MPFPKNGHSFVKKNFYQPTTKGTFLLEPRELREREQ